MEASILPKRERHLQKMALLMPCSRHNSATGVPATACFRMDIIWLSVKRDFFTEISPVQITREFYLWTYRFFGRITVAVTCLYWLHKFRSRQSGKTLASCMFTGTGGRQLWLDYRIKQTGVIYHQPTLPLSSRNFRAGLFPSHPFHGTWLPLSRWFATVRWRSASFPGQ